MMGFGDEILSVYVLTFQGLPATSGEAWPLVATALMPQFFFLVALVQRSLTFEYFFSFFMSSMRSKDLSVELKVIVAFVMSF